MSNFRLFRASNNSNRRRCTTSFARWNTQILVLGKFFCIYIYIYIYCLLTSTSAVASKKSPLTNDRDYGGFHENYNLQKKNESIYLFIFYCFHTKYRYHINKYRNIVCTLEHTNISTRYVRSFVYMYILFIDVNKRRHIKKITINK